MTKLSRAKKYLALAGLLLLFPLGFLLFFSSMEHKFDTMPYFGEHLVVEQSKPGGVVFDTIYYRIPDFELTNQDGIPFHSDSLKGKVYLAAFFSTSSPYLAKITKRLLSVNFKYRREPDIGIVCFSTDPEYDQPKKLARYVDELRVDRSKFTFLTGSVEEMSTLITDGFLIPDYKNTSSIWLVDPEGHLRGKYNGNKEEELQRAVEDIALLKKEIDVRNYRQRKNAN